ncbi:MAG: hypothetical protein Q7K55_05980 [Candidatus Levybacteria bacterium]|nr:hypothetical protein [Candidatus Levybacteria bacterium]
MISPEIRIGLTEAAHFVSGRRKLTAPLTRGIRDAVDLGYDAYEAMPSLSTAFEVLALGLSKNKNPEKASLIKRYVVNMHPNWMVDRWVSPRPGANDSFLGYIKRWPQSLAVSAPFLSIPAMRIIEKESGATISWHWPVLENQANNWGNFLSKKFQEDLESTGGVLLAENHALIGLSDEGMKKWIAENPKKRGFTFVSGHDVRDTEYAGRSQVNPYNFLPETRGLYIKDGWNEATLRKDLELVLRNRTNAEPLWLMVNYGEGAKSEVAQKLQRMVRDVLGSR